MAIAFRASGYPTGDVYDDALLYGGWRWASATKTTVIKYHFSNKYYKWTKIEKNAFKAALASYSEVINIKFKEVKKPKKADWVEYSIDNKLGGSDLNGSHGGPSYSLGPNPKLGKNGQVFGYFNWKNYTPNGNGKFHPEGLKKGGYGFNTFVHEIGHALGLAHPFAPNYGQAVFPLVNTQTALGHHSFNQGIFTVMSYNYGWESRYEPEKKLFASYGYDAGPMAFDIHALVKLYGANTSSSGNTTYYLPNNISYWKTIFDVGGIDSIVYSGSRGTQISLLAVSPDIYADWVTTHFFDGKGGFVVGRDVRIEKAFGGSGPDAIIGGTTPNTIYGRGGDDSINGTVWSGDNDADTMYGGDGNDDIQGGPGKDTLYGGNGNDVIAGDWHSAGNFFPQLNNDRIFGGSGDDQLRGQIGDDYLDGGSGNDLLYGDGNVGNGKDTLLGGDGDDTIDGQAGSDLIIGGRGRDKLTGGENDDDGDIFKYLSIMDSRPGDANCDLIRLKSTDKIDLSAIDARSDVEGNQAFVLAASGTPSAAGELGYTSSGGRTWIVAMVDNDSSYDLQIEYKFLNGAFNLDSHFLL